VPANMAQVWFVASAACEAVAPQPCVVPAVIVTVTPCEGT
jgi:hypothetical protein